MNGFNTEVKCASGDSQPSSPRVDCVSLPLPSKNKHPSSAALPDRSCDSCVVFRGELLNYCPALHALNRPKRKRERKNHVLFSLGLSPGRSHESCAYTESPKEVRSKLSRPLTIAIVITGALAAGKRDS